MPSIADNSIHFLFDHLGWLLLPETHIIETYYNSLTPVSGIRLTQRGSFPVIEVRLLSLLTSVFFTWIILEWSF